MMARAGDWSDEPLEQLRAPFFDALLQPDDVRACLLYARKAETDGLTT